VWLRASHYSRLPSPREAVRSGERVRVGKGEGPASIPAGRRGARRRRRAWPRDPGRSAGRRPIDASLAEAAPTSSRRRSRVTLPGKDRRQSVAHLSPTCRPDDPDSPDLRDSQPTSPALSRKRQVAGMTVQVGATLGFSIIRRAGSTPGASTSPRLSNATFPANVTRDFFEIERRSPNRIRSHRGTGRRQPVDASWSARLARDTFRRR